MVTIITTTARAEVARAVEFCQAMPSVQPCEEKGQPPLFFEEEQEEAQSSLTAPGAAVLLEEQEEAQPSLTAPGAALLPVAGHSAASLQLLAHPPLTAPGVASLQQPSVPQQDPPETPPGAAE